MAGPNPVRGPVPGGISVCGLRAARRHQRRFDAVITIEEPAAREADRLRFHRPPHPAHLVLRFEDIDGDWHDLWGPSIGDVAQALDFAREHAARAVLIHCRQGVGRSAGIALAVLADRVGPGQEAEALAALLAIRPEAVPNRLVIGHADVLLRRGGALVAAVDAWEARTPAAQRQRAVRRDFVARFPHLYARRPRGTG